jgi:hypothetical protein
MNTHLMVNELFAVFESFTTGIAEEVLFVGVNPFVNVLQNTETVCPVRAVLAGVQF